MELLHGGSTRQNFMHALHIDISQLLTVTTLVENNLQV